MKILHFALGFPPYRTGGLTRYAMDLITTQSKNNNTVAMLWTGQITGLKKEIRIKETKYTDKIKSYELINPLPVSLLEGINDIAAYTKPIHKQVYEDFFNTHHFDVVHIHTFMGMHKEFLEVAKSRKIKILFTSHDYFGLCPFVNFLDYNNVPHRHCARKDCEKCCQNALSLQKIKIMQSRIYRTLKNSWLVKKTRSNYKNKRITNTLTKEITNIDYQPLFDYYQKMFSYVDCFLFNSQLAKEIYTNYLDIEKEKITPVMHLGIQDARIKKESNQQLKIAFLGPLEEYKGFTLVIEALDKMIENTYSDVELNIFTTPYLQRDYIKVNPRFEGNQLQQILKPIDVLVVPSIWYETYGFVVIEALSNGVPVIVSTHVGSKDLIKDGENGYIVNATAQNMYEKLVQLYQNRNILQQMNTNICQDTTICFEYDYHYKQIMEAYGEVITDDK